MDVKIRLAKTEDAPLIESLLIQSFAEFESFYTPEAFQATAVKSNEIIERMKEGPVWAAVENGKIIGTVSSVLRNGSLYIRGMAVHPEARARGIGELLLNEAEKHALAIKCSRLYLGTTKYLLSAIRLYERMGYRAVEGVEDFYGMDLIIMEKYIDK
jgi:GNAT superfamily N-acetyltransferase